MHDRSGAPTTQRDPRRWSVVVVCIAVLGPLGVATSAVVPAGSPLAAPAADAAIIPVQGGLGYTPLGAPCRAADTRGAAVLLGDVKPGETRGFQIRGATSFASQGGSPTGCGVPSNATAVEVTITAVGPSEANGFLRVAPAGSTVDATFLNYTVGRGISNTGTVPLNTQQIPDLAVSNSGGRLHLVVDVQGYFTASGGRSFVPLTSPCRVVDTRAGGGSLGPGAARTLKVAGIGASFAAQGGTPGGCGVPTGVTAVEISVTAAAPTGNGFLQLAPNDSSVPTTAFLNYTDGTGITNTGSVTLSTEPADLFVRNQGGSTHVLVDVQGFYTTTPGLGSRYQAVTPCRAADTRNSGGPLGPGRSRLVQVGGGNVDYPTQGTPNLAGCVVPQRAAAVEASITAVGPLGAGFTRPGPAGSVATTTFLNYTGVGGITNSGTIRLAIGGTGDLAISNQGGTSGYIVDVLGYYEPLAAPALPAERVDAGGPVSCVVVGGDRIRCAGDNSSGQLGDGTTRSRSTPTPVSGLIDGVLQVASGEFHTCALVAATTARCWGGNSSGQLGDGTILQRLTPVIVSGLTGATQITAGNSHTCALRRSDGGVRCWGFNGAGMLGDGTTTTRTAPVAVSGLSGAAQIVGGGDHTCAALRDGTARCWWFNTNGQLGDGSVTQRTAPVAVSGLTDVVQLAAGESHTCALRGDGTVRCWGLNQSRQLGDGTTTQRTTPVTVPGLFDVVRIAAGDAHTCALLGDGTARCWGDNTTGQLGSGSTAQPTGPVSVSGLTGAVQITAGQFHSCATLRDGTARCWGLNSVGQLADGTITQRTTPSGVAGLSGALQLGSSGDHSCAPLAAGTLRCWGANTSGQVGDGTSGNIRTFPTATTGAVDAVQVDGGAGHSCAVLADRTVRCWGLNSSGQVGDGTTTPRLAPTEVSGLAGSPLIALANQVDTGGDHSCALLTDSTIRCWGRNTNGQLGDGTTTQRTTSVAVPGLVAPIQVTAGDAHTCALLADRTVRCWGDNSTGQLGDNSTTQRTSPVTVAALNNVDRISAGGSHTCAVLLNGGVRCWGENTDGRLGDNSTTQRTAPVAVVGLTSATRVAAGGDHTCAVLQDATIRCWGRNLSGQVGDGSTTARLTPVNLAGLDKANTVDVVTGRAHSCSLSSSGSVRCWGENVSGQIGDGTSGTNRTSPVTVSGLS